MEELLEAAPPSSPAWAAAGAVDAAAFVLSRLPHPATDAAAFVDAATSTALSFLALRRGALSLASGLRLGLGLRRGDAVLVLSHNSLLLPQILLGVLAAGAVVVTADPDATPAEVAAAAHGSGAAIVVAEPEAAGKVAGIGVPLLLTSRSPDDPRTLSAEELIDGADPLEDPAATPEGRPRPSDVAFLAYSSAGRAAAAMTHADLVVAMCGAAALGLGLPRHDGDRRRVCLASIPMCSAQGLPLLALGLPAAEATTVLVPPTSDPRPAVAAHAATDIVVAAPELAAALTAPMPHDGRLSSLRRVVVVAATTPLTAEAREEFRRRLPWVELTQLLPGVPDNQMEEIASEQVQVAPGPVVLGTQTPVMQHNDTLPADQMSATNEAASPVPPLKKIQKIILGDIFSRSTTSKILRKHPVTGNRQAASKL